MFFTSLNTAPRPRIIIFLLGLFSFPFPFPFLPFYLFKLDLLLYKKHNKIICFLEGIFDFLTRCSRSHRSPQKRLRPRIRWKNDGRNEIRPLISRNELKRRPIDGRTLEVSGSLDPLPGTRAATATHLTRQSDWK